MNPTTSISTGLSSGKLRLLVGIACFGEKNTGLLMRVIASYQCMPLDVTVVVFSNIPRDLGPNVNVVVGLPSKNPWSLPFAHKTYFAAHAHDYDLFIYSEDDMVITHESIQAFVRITPALAPNEIAGFIRYELNGEGARSMPDIHAGFHWKDESVRQRGPYSVAEHTCEHAGFYLLTKDQLLKAIASGGYVRAPYTDQYDLACTAATDPYLRCGFTRVVCFSEMESFLIHHASNRYVGELGISWADFQRELQALGRIASGALLACSLCETESKMYNRYWSKSCYEMPIASLIDLVPASTQTALSFGSGWGATELALRAKGVKVTMVPIDSIMGFIAKELNFEVIPAKLPDWISQLGSRRFDCVLVPNLVHLVPDQVRLINELCSVVAPGGTLLMSGPNLYSLSMLFRRVRDSHEYRGLSHFDQGGIHLRTVRALSELVRQAGLAAISKHWYNAKQSESVSFVRRRLPSYFSTHWIIQAKRV